LKNVFRYSIKGGVGVLIDQYKESINKATKEQLKTAVTVLLGSHAAPVFGAAKTVEHEIAALNALKALGYLADDSDEFTLVEKLRITKSKARSLLYQTALRKIDEDEAEKDMRLINALKSTQIVKEGNLFIIEVPDPLTMDRMRKIIRDAGYLSDETFSNSLARIPEEALVALMVELIPEKDKKAMEKKMSDSGVTDISIPGLIKAIIKQEASKIAGDTGNKAARIIGDKIFDTLENISSMTIEKINKIMSL